MDIGLFRGLLTVTLMVLFIGLWVRSWTRGRRGDYDEAERLPLEEDQELPPTTESNKERYS